MNVAGWSSMIAFPIVLVLLAYPLGLWMARLADGEPD